MKKFFLFLVSLAMAAAIGILAADRWAGVHESGREKLPRVAEKVAVVQRPPLPDRKPRVERVEQPMLTDKPAKPEKDEPLAERQPGVAVSAVEEADEQQAKQPKAPDTPSADTLDKPGLNAKVEELQTQPTVPAEPAPPAPETKDQAPAATKEAMSRTPREPPARTEPDKPAEPPAAEKAPLPEGAPQAPDTAVRPETTAPSVPGYPLPNPKRTARLREMIGQMLIFGFQGTKPEQGWPQTIARQLRDGTIGGVIFLRHNLDNRQDAWDLVRYLRNAGDKAKLRPLYVLDQEGGRVQRLGPRVGVPKWPAPATIAKGSPEAARTKYDAMAAELAKWGFNVNLGPVVDVDVNPNNPIIGKFGRSFSPDPNRVATFAGVFIEAHRQRHILTALKHFPGHGSSETDSHLGFTDISRSWKPNVELLPYRALMGKADMVMIGHLYLDRFRDNGSAQKYPATFSRRIVSGLLRNELNFRGVVISDDMEMGAIRKHYRTFDAAVLAIKAGIDLLIVSNSAKPDSSLPEAYVAQIASRAERDDLLRRRIKESYDRIVALKTRLSARQVPASKQSTERRRDGRPAGLRQSPPRADLGAIPGSQAPAHFEKDSLASRVDRLFPARP